MLAVQWCTTALAFSACDLRTVQKLDTPYTVCKTPLAYGCLAHLMYMLCAWLTLVDICLAMSVFSMACGGRLRDLQQHIACMPCKHGFHQTSVVVACTKARHLTLLASHMCALLDHLHTLLLRPGQVACRSHALQQPRLLYAVHGFHG